ncbi:twitching motility protein PilT [Tindallia magadiensis]|uniref:Twitching motility protein PilT n=1 Tax=Tindallia magadiensis TaxID=69895 RepID=A0A1I3G640_9FIRM|nr:type IV pilus twitching motility protein PilT [Tindallia magadiensis]SFI18965.1 twitching motility protein PilT [Tindallia magadiensis]
MHDAETLLKIAVKEEASDLFITVGRPPTLKINGRFRPIEKECLRPEDTEKLVKNLFHKEKHYEEFVENGEKDFSVSLSGIGRFRVAAYTQRSTSAAAIRVLSFEQPDPEALGIPSGILDFYQRKKGLILVTGPTGSGKSTTLSAIIHLINQNRECHILTLEDPIEYLHRHQKSLVDQREIGMDTKSYAKALRSALRQAPDVIQVGEMRDHETISIALTAAETGHLVFSTLHTVGAAKSIDRIIDVFPANQQDQIRVQLSTVLYAVVSQQLMPSKEGGLVPAFEILIVNGAIRNMIRDGKIPQIDAAIQTGKAQGMISMDLSLAKLVEEDKIHREDALTHCVHPEVLKKYLPQP